MPPLAEIRHRFDGAWRLARGDPGGMEHFDVSIEGFWRSFWALVIVAPGYAILVADQHVRSGGEGGIWAIVLAESLGYVLGWMVLPVCGIFLTRLFGLSHRYVPMIVALNWAALVQLAVFLVPLALSVILPREIVLLLLMIATGALLFYQGFVIKTALDCPTAIAVAFVAFDVVAVTMLNSMLFALFVGRVG